MAIPKRRRGTHLHTHGLPEADRERRVLAVRVGPEARQALQDAAAREGLSVSALVEQWAQAGCPMVVASQG
jgi:predicted HicB family RNase H-like nuclease